MDGVLDLILGFVPTGLVALTNRATSRAWAKVARTRLIETFDRTGLQLESVHRSFGVPDVGLEAIFRTMRNQHTAPVCRNSCDGLVFVLALVIGQEERVLRVLEAPCIEFEDFGDCSELVLTFDTAVITTKRKFIPNPNDVTGVAPIFLDKSDEPPIMRCFRGAPPQDVAEEPLIMKVSAYDRNTNKVAHVYCGQLQDRIIPCENDWGRDFHSFFGFRFEHEVVVSTSKYISASGEIFFDAEEFRRDVVPDAVFDDHGREMDHIIEHFRRWAVPSGTNFTTVKLIFEDIEDIVELKALLNWAPPQ